MTEEDKVTTLGDNPCTVKDCTCGEFIQPTAGNACATCGHSSEKHC